MKRLESNRLLLREWTANDVDDLYEYAQSDLVGPNAGWKPHANKEESLSIVNMFIDVGDTYAIQLKDNGKVIGGIGLHDRKPDESLEYLKQLEVGYVLNPDYWGNGYVPEAVERVKSFAFDELNIDLLWCGHYDYNMNSKRVNEKCGFIYRFTKEEVLRLLDDKKVNTLYYSLFNPKRRGK